MTPFVFGLIYIFGGLTFIPLVIASILFPAWLVLPVVDDANGSQEKGNVDDTDELKAKEALLASQEEKYVAESAASGVLFAVLRAYDFQAANNALNARANASNNAANSSSSDGGVEGAGSESVYQSMYRSVFDRNKTNTSKSSLSADDSTDSGRKAVPPSIFHVVLRHGHLMLYNSPAQTEVRHVIGLTHYSISLTTGLMKDRTGDDPEDGDEAAPDGELFIKRTAILLTPNPAPDGLLQLRNQKPKPFYLFSSNCSEKEDFYQALLLARTQPPPPVPHAFRPDDAIKLQSSLHSAALTPETRAVNALLGRVFLGIYQTDKSKRFIWDKVEKKISRVQKPAFISSLEVQAIDLGDSAPIFSNLRLKELNISGDTIVGLDIRYTGGLNITIKAQAKIDLGQRFKVRTVDLVLASSVQKLQGHMLLRIKPPPSNRIWFCFETLPDVDIKVEPVVSQRRISYTFILRAIEERIRSVLAETLVKPNWDDIPFYDTVGQRLRGGIWENGGDVADSEPDGDLSEVLRKKSQKTKSMPALPGVVGAETDSSTTSSGSETTSKLAMSSSPCIAAEATPPQLKRRSVPALPPRPSSSPPDKDESQRSDPKPLRPVRSPSFPSSTVSMPSVALNEASVNPELNRGDVAPLQPRRWGQQQHAQMAARNAVETMREVRDRSLQSYGAEKPRARNVPSVATSSSTDDEDRTSLEQTESSMNAAEEKVDSPLHSHTRASSGFSISTLDAAGPSSASRAQQPRKAVLTAAASATTAARNWGWNAIQSRTKAGREGSVSSQQLEPVGRGQPLPPPGTPLPGPPKGWGLGLGSVKRKPVSTPQRTNKGADLGEQKISKELNSASDHGSTQEAEELDPSDIPDEFGPWRQNSGLEEMNDETLTKTGDPYLREDAPDQQSTTGEPKIAEKAVSGNTDGDRQRTPANEKKRPPPLPARRKATSLDLAAADAVVNRDVAPDPQSTSSAALATSSDTSAEAHVAKNIHIDNRGDAITDFTAASPVRVPRNDMEAHFAKGSDLEEADFEHIHESFDNDVLAIPAPVEVEVAETRPSEARETSEVEA